LENPLLLPFIKGERVLNLFSDVSLSDQKGRSVSTIAEHPELRFTSPFCKGGLEGDLGFPNEKGFNKGKKYGNLVACFVRCRLGGASGLHSAEAWDLHLNAGCLPGRQSRQNRNRSAEEV
jgi:hypothetical protein